jgi:hypothetical protein
VRLGNRHVSSREAAPTNSPDIISLRIVAKKLQCGCI